MTRPGVRPRAPRPLQLAPLLLRHFINHPKDIMVVLRAGWHLRRRAWWRHAPFLPLPGPEYWRFRMVTLNGSSDAAPDATEIVAAARWATAQRASR